MLPEILILITGFTLLVIGAGTPYLNNLLRLMVDSP